jgi:flagellin
MGLVLTNNVSSLTAQNNLNSTNNALSKSLERLSTGLKVNRGADGPAALVISEQQRAQIAGIRSAIDNTNKAVALVQTGEGALNEINSLLGKVRGLVLDSANVGVNDTNTLAANQAEISNALTTITSIANQTQFGTKKLLDGSAALSASSNNTNVSASASGSIAAGSYTISISSAATRANVAGQAGRADNTDITAGGTITSETLTINGTNVSFTLTQSDLQASVTAAAAAINNAAANTGVRAIVDDSTAANATLRLYSVNYGTGNKISVSSNNAAANSVLGTVAGNVDGTDIQGTFTEVASGASFSATGTGNVLTAGSGAANGLVATVNPTVTGDTYTNATANSFTSASGASLATITVDTSKALTFQIGANAGQTAQIAVNDARAAALGKGASSFTTDLTQIDVTKLTGNGKLSSDFLKVVDKAISDVTAQRGQLGAFQANTLQSNANNLQTTLQNTTAAESTIRDTDFASEIANFTKLQTQLQAGSTVLGNANQLTQLVAGLLRG